jgi:hypothetical protein
MINSVRTGLNLMMAAIIARYGITPSRTPDFTISETGPKFLAAVGRSRKQKVDFRPRSYRDQNNKSL